MGATGRSGLVRLLLGSTTRRVLAELPCSLLTVKQNDLFDDSGSADEREQAQTLAEGLGGSACCAT
jgi:hypothetical protein